MNPEFEQMDHDEEDEVLEDESMDDESSESDEEENDNSQEIIIANINRIQDELSMNQYDYNKHKELIQNIRSLGETDLIRDARERMRLLFPLEESVWLQWIEDEMSLGSDGFGKEKMLELFEMAIGDFLSPEIWSTYCEYCYAELPPEQARKVMEKALHTVGSHYLQGRNIYKIFQKFEKDSFETTSTAEDISTGFQRYLNLFERQFSIPLQNMENDLKELKEYVDIFKQQHPEIPDLTKQMNKIEELFNNTVSSLKEYQEFEDRILNEDKDTLKRADIYKEYVEFIMKKNGNNLESIICLYERAIAQCYNDVSLWNDYVMYCDLKLIIPEILFPIYERSVRNVPWSSEIWIRFLNSKFRLLKTSDPNCIVEVKSFYERAIQNQFSTVEDYRNLTLAQLNGLKKIFSKMNYWKQNTADSVRGEFQAPIDAFSNSYGEENCYELKKFQAFVEAKYLESKNNATKIYEELSKTFKHYASFWIDYASFIHDHFSDEAYKKILLQGLQTCLDYPETIGDILMKYYREIDDNMFEMVEVELKVKAVMKKVAIRRAKEEAKNKAFEEKQLSKETNNKTPAKKRKNEDSKSQDSKAKGQTKQSPETKKQKKEPVDSGKHGVTVQTDPLKVSQTVFLSNLSFDVEEEEIKKEFSKFGEINEVRLVRNFKGNSKGYCYVEFKDPQTVHQALLHDRMMIHGRPVFISEMDKKSGFSYSLNAEKNKLFVKNIPLSYTKEDVISKIFTEFSDSIKDVRLVTYRNGFSKGWAYVELKDEDTAKKAVEAKNDKEYEGRNLFVAISDPSKSVKATNDKTFPVKGTSAGPATNPKTKFGSTNFMVPTSVRLKNISQKPRLAETAASTSSASQQSGSDTPGGNLSNDQFRSFLTKK